MMAQRALKHGVFVTGGVIEEAEDGRLYNAMPIYAPDGTLVANYRKVHLSRVMGITSESDVLTAGDVLTAFNMPDSSCRSSSLRVGMACCFDLRFPVFLAQ